MPLRPHHVKLHSTGWQVQGLHEDGQVEASLQFTRQARDGMPPGEGIGTTLPPFLQVERELSLGLTWQVATRVRQVTPAGSAVVATVPLLPCKAVTTPGMRVVEGKALVNLEPVRVRSLGRLSWSGSRKFGSKPPPVMVVWPGVKLGS